MDNFKIKGEQDLSKINMQKPHEVQYWTKHLGVSKEDLQKAVDKVGNNAATWSGSNWLASLFLPMKMWQVKSWPPDYTRTHGQLTRILPPELRNLDHLACAEPPK